MGREILANISYGMVINYSQRTIAIFGDDDTALSLPRFTAESIIIIIAIISDSGLYMLRGMLHNLLLTVSNRSIAPLRHYVISVLFTVSSINATHDNCVQFAPISWDSYVSLDL
jgi:hypothetical protein